MTEPPIGAMRLFLQKWEREKQATVMTNARSDPLSVRSLQFATYETERAFTLLMQELREYVRDESEE